MGLLEEEEAEFADLLLALAEDVRSTTFRMTSVMPEPVHRQLHDLERGRIPEDVGKKLPIPTPTQSTIEGNTTTESTLGADPRVSEASSSAPGVAWAASDASRASAWMKVDGKSGERASPGRAVSLWGRLRASLLHFCATVLVSVPTALVVPILVTATEGSKPARLSVFVAPMAAFIFATYRLFWVCSGHWSRRSVALGFLLLGTSVVVVAVFGPPRLHTLAAFSVRVAWLYVLTVLCWDRAKRHPLRRVSQILGFAVSAVPFYAAPLIHGWLARQDLGKREIAGMEVEGRMAVAGLVWTAIGFLMQYFGTTFWRYGCVPGRRTLKIFEFNVHTEVALTTGGMQLFTGDAMLLYVLWALGVDLVHGLMMLLPLSRNWASGGCLAHRLAAGSTPALHIVHLFVNLVAKVYGILLSLIFLLLCSLAQAALHPECPGRGFEARQRMSLMAPTLPFSRLPLWAACTFSCVLVTAMTVLAAIFALRYVDADFRLGAGRDQQRMSGLRRRSVVEEMTREQPAALLIGLVHACGRASRVEVRAVIFMQLLLMPYFWFNMVPLDKGWQNTDSWFYC